jgi:hypothetical protein
MAIRVQKVEDDLYEAVLTLPDMPDVKEAWISPAPMGARQLTKELLRRGCHQQDIGDALYAVDPSWVEKMRD